MDKASYQARFALRRVGGLVTSDAVYKSFYYLSQVVAHR